MVEYPDNAFEICYLSLFFRVRSVSWNQHTGSNVKGCKFEKHFLIQTAYLHNNFTLTLTHFS